VGLVAGALFVFYSAAFWLALTSCFLAVLLAVPLVSFYF